MELLRGLVANTFGLLFLFVHVRFFFYIPGIYLIIDGALEMHITSLIDLITKHTCVTLVGVKPQRDGKGESMHETFSVQDLPATRTGKCVHACTHPA
jgi:hypothetical protein